MFASFRSRRVFDFAVTRYALAFTIAAIALLLCRLLAPFLPDHSPLTLLTLAIAFSAWYCGVGPSLVALTVAVVGARFATQPHPQWIALLAFFIVSVALIVMGEIRRRQNAVLRQGQAELEQRVEERTAELDIANHGLRELSARLMQLQDDERRRIARELHDSVGQTLAGLAMNIANVRAEINRVSETATVLNDSEALIQEMTREVRTISHLLHPPLLDEAGLTSALRWFIDGFSQRSKIQVDLLFPADFGRLNAELETTIFRVVQECLTNIHRHSGSEVAKVRITRSDENVKIEISDKGKGIPAAKQEEMEARGAPGVGIRGMRERLRQLGGHLEIRSDGKGTVVVASLPVPARSTIVAA
jgi:signal transduction histidine kinase